jgi:hypothetical protein
MEVIISRKEAKARGLVRYFTGKPCRHGHVAERYLNSGSCVDCQKEWHRRYGPDCRKQRYDPDYHRRYQETHRKEIQENRRRFREANPLYRTWENMIQRCTNPNNIGWKYYGGRGIELYRPWRESFECFAQHVGHKPSPRHSLDRKNNEYGYFPGNVRWSTRKEQSQNCRRPAHWRPATELALAA